MADPERSGLAEPKAGFTGFGKAGSAGIAGGGGSVGFGVDPRKGFASSGGAEALAGGSTARRAGANCGCVNCGGVNAGGEPSAGGMKSGTGLVGAGGSEPIGGVELGANGAAEAVVGGQSGKLSVLAGSINADGGRCATWSGASADGSAAGASAAAARGGVVIANWWRSSELQPSTQLIAHTGTNIFHRGMRLPRFLASSALSPRAADPLIGNQPLSGSRRFAAGRVRSSRALAKKITPRD